MAGGSFSLTGSASSVADGESVELTAGSSLSGAGGMAVFIAVSSNSGAGGSLLWNPARKGQCGAFTSHLRVSIINTTINQRWCMIQGDAIGILVAMIRNQPVVDQNSLPGIDTAIPLKYRCITQLNINTCKSKVNSV
jgi:hypothetical protein